MVSGVTVLLVSARYNPTYVVLKSENPLWSEQAADVEPWYLFYQVPHGRTGFDEYFTEALAAEWSSDEELETTLMSQPVWEGEVE